MLYKTEWSWELRTWSHKINLIDTSTNSPHYFYWQRIGITSENLNFDVKVYTIGLLAVRKQVRFHQLWKFIDLQFEIAEIWQGLHSKRKKNESWVRNKILESLRNVLKIQIYFHFLNNLLLFFENGFEDSTDKYYEQYCNLWNKKCHNLLHVKFSIFMKFSHNQTRKQSH